jgi:hypothetical protein
MCISRIIALIPSFGVLFIALKKMRIIAARENKKELKAAGYSLPTDAKGQAPQSSKGATSTTSERTSEKVTKGESDKPGSEKADSDREKDVSTRTDASGNPIGKTAKKAKTSAATPVEVSLPQREQTGRQKLNQLCYEISLWPAAFMKSVVVRILTIAQCRGYLNLILLFGMLFSTPAADASQLVVWVWALGQLLFWLQQTLTVFRFFEMNIRSETMNSKGDIPILNKIKQFYTGIYFFVVLGQCAFISIAHVPKLETKLTMYAIWNGSCGVHAVCQLSCAIFALKTTNGFLEKSLKTSTNEKQKESVANVKKKNDTFIKLLIIVGTPACLLFILPPMIPGFLLQIDFIVMFLSVISGAIMLSGLRFFK